jgi:dodecin
MDSLEGSSVYNVIEVVGTSKNGWEEAIKNSVDNASNALTNRRIIQVVELDVKLSEGRIMEYRARVKLSFKHENEPETL